MPEETTTFLVPWVYRGIDSTTQHRLRVPMDLLERQPGFPDGGSLVLERAQLAPLEGYFSKREFPLLKRLVIVPFFDREALVAAFLLIDSEAGPVETTATLSSLESVATEIGAKINRARAFLGPGAIELGRDALRSHLSTLMSEAQDSGLYVTMVRVDLQRLARTLLGSSTSADIYRFKRDLSAALTTMVSGNGELVSIGEREVLLAVQSRNPYSERLLSHQFAEGVRSLFSEAPELASLADQTWRYPDGGNSIDEVIDSILA